MVSGFKKQNKNKPPPQHTNNYKRHFFWQPGKLKYVDIIENLFRATVGNLLWNGSGTKKSIHTKYMSQTFWKWSIWIGNINMGVRCTIFPVFWRYKKIWNQKLERKRTWVFLFNSFIWKKFYLVCNSFDFMKLLQLDKKYWQKAVFMFVTCCQQGNFIVLESGLFTITNWSKNKSNWVNKNLRFMTNLKNVRNSPLLIWATAQRNPIYCKQNSHTFVFHTLFKEEVSLTFWSYEETQFK